MNGGKLHLYELGEGGNGIVVGFDPPVSSGKGRKVNFVYNTRPSYGKIGALSQ